MAWMKGEEEDLARLSLSTNKAGVEMSFQGSRTSSSGSLNPFRFGLRSDSSQRSSLSQERDSSDGFTNGRARRTSMQSNFKGKESAHDAFNGRASPTTAFSLTPSASFPSSRFKPSHEHPRPVTADSAMPTRRGSLLGAASDALGRTFTRKKPPIIRKPAPMPLVFPDVIEISASRRYEEDEERDRLREVAAQSLGLQVTSTPETHSLDEKVEEVDEEQEEAVEHHQEANLPPAASNEKQADYFSRSTPLSPIGSVYSIPPPSPGPVTRLRSHSVAHSRANSISSSPIPSLPPFPATFTAIDQFQQCGTMLYKYYQPSSLRIFALSKNWRHRFMVLSSPMSIVTRNSGPSVSYLHLFKSSAGEEKELERLEINEESVVFVAEEEVGGRKHVVKVGGVDVGAMKKELNCEECGRTMWFLDIRDSTEAQKWITVIKAAILGQRSVRAGLGLPTIGATEPSGDMDVILSMRAQGFIMPPLPTSPKSPQHELPQNGTVTPDRNYASSISSHHSQGTSRNGSTVTGPVSALKSIFTGSTRPRSGSRATSIDSQRDNRDAPEGSFGSMGHQLLNKPGAVDATIRPHSVTTHASLPISGSMVMAEHRLDRKITTDRHWASTLTTTVEVTTPKSDRANKSLSLGALSLQPPPRKRWTSAGPPRPGPESLMKLNEEPTPSHETATATPVGKAETEPSSSPVASGFTFGTPEKRTQTPSIQSVSTMASADNTPGSAEKKSKRSSRRWSRQGVLPRRLSPPSGPPPSTPTDQKPAVQQGRLSLELPANRSEDESAHSVASHKSFVSTFPSFKRASGSSILSASSSVRSTAVSRPPSTQSHRLSMPPQRPPPTSALPPAPGQNEPEPPATAPPKLSFRDSVAQRAFRLSMVAPKPPPSIDLPPRPDEASSKSRRRNSSVATFSHQPMPLASIPASPVPTPVAPAPRFPPPNGPLPPTPTVQQPPTTTHPSRPLSRHISLKKRLRILSAPTPAPAGPSLAQSQSLLKQSEGDDDNVLDGFAPLRRPIPGIPSTTVSPPPTPIGEKIIVYQDDPSFLQINTPVIPYIAPRSLPIPPEPHPEIISLSPPPRRGSKQISVLGPEADDPNTEEDTKLPLDGERRLISLSRPGSVVSLGIVSM